MSDQKVCPTCGTEYPLSERFCPRDGTALRSANASADLLGSIIAERYHILKKLGEGGMGTVYLAEHVKMGRKSALKVMNPGMNSDPDAIARFNREASNASRLSHPNICGIYDFGETSEGLIYLAMEFIEGKALTDLIEADGALAPARAGSIVHQTADALQVAHDAGIVHRDLKPDNMMVAKARDGSDLVKVVDFGIAKASSSDAQKVTKTGLVVGTPEYMSPEQLAGDKLDGRSDIYSLALVAFNCLTGKLPFPSESAQEAMIMRLTDKPKTLAEMRPEVAWPASLQAVMDKALARAADERYQSAAQFGREFADALHAMPSVAATEGATMVIGAQSAPAGAAGPTKPMPATRVSRADAVQTPPKGRPAAPAAPEKKSSIVPIAAGGGVVAIAAVVAWMMLGKPDTTPTDPNAGTPLVQGPDSGAAAGAETTLTNRQMNPEQEAPRTDPDPPPRQPSGGNSTPTTTTPPPTTSPVTPTAMARMEGWIAELQAANVTPNTARRIAAEVEALRPSLTGLELAESWYVSVVANTAREDIPATCSAARELQRLHTEQSRKDFAAFTLANICQ